MELGPILRALWRNRTGAVLIALQIALTMAVIVNGYVVVTDRIEHTGRPSGMDEADLLTIVSHGFGANFAARATVEDDLARLRGLPDVTGAVQMNAIPLSGSGWSMGLQHTAGDTKDPVSVAVYMVDAHGLDVLGVRLLAGRNFTDADVVWRQPADPGWPPSIIVSADTATALFPDAAEGAVAALGRTVYIANTLPVQIIGIIERLQAPWNDWPGVGQTVLVPQQMEFNATQYLIRARPGTRDATMLRVEEALSATHPDRIVHELRSMADIRYESYRTDTGLATVLGVVMGILIAITALGIVGLASFSVSRRTRQIGTRRALGARRSDILRHFLVENFVITTFGVALGALLTVGLNVWLVGSMNFPKLDWPLVPIGMVTLWLIGLAAVYGPARRACAVPPAVATRTV